MLLAFCVTRLYIPIFFSECGHTHFGVCVVVGGGKWIMKIFGLRLITKVSHPNKYASSG